MGFIRNNNVWKINKILAGISGGGVSPEDVQDMIDTSLTPIETEIEGKQDVLTAGAGINITEDVIKTSEWQDVTAENKDTVFSSVFSEGYITYKDILLYYVYNPKGSVLPIIGCKYIPKGTKLLNTLFDLGVLISATTSNNGDIVHFGSLQLSGNTIKDLSTTFTLVGRYMCYQSNSSAGTVSIDLFSNTDYDSSIITGSKVLKSQVTVAISGQFKLAILYKE